MSMTFYSTNPEDVNGPNFSNLNTGAMFSILIKHLDDWFDMLSKENHEVKQELLESIATAQHMIPEEGVVAKTGVKRVRKLTSLCIRSFLYNLAVSPELSFTNKLEQEELDMFVRVASLNDWLSEVSHDSLIYAT